jgi:hypothetical protein
MSVPEGLDLDDVFCFEEHRTLQNDWCIRHENRHYQILKENRPLPKPKDRILVRTHLDGRTQLLFHDKPLAFEGLTPTQRIQQRSRQGPRPRIGAKPKTAPKPPSPEHPWRRRCIPEKDEDRR